MMQENVFSTDRGEIHYWVNDHHAGRRNVVMLPGLTADHHLFDKQWEAFEDTCNLLVWDAPEHAASRPFSQDYTLMDKAKWLHGILEEQNMASPVLIGQSMGGYAAQCFLEKYPGEAAGFVSIDSAPLKRRYVTSAEIFLLKHTGPMFRAFPWETLKRLGVSGTAMSAYGREQMKYFMDTYSKEEYCALADHGFRILAEAMEADLPYEIGCPVILICGEKDQAGSAKNYNKRWAKQEHLTLFMIPGAGHNANADSPETVNAIIRRFMDSLEGTI